MIKYIVLFVCISGCTYTFKVSRYTFDKEPARSYVKEAYAFDTTWVKDSTFDKWIIKAK